MEISLVEDSDECEITGNDEDSDTGEVNNPAIFSRRDAIRGTVGLFLYLSGCNERGSTTELEFSLRRSHQLTPQQQAEEYLNAFKILEREINDRRYDFPQNERETALLANHSRRQSNQKIRVPFSLKKKKDGSLVISRFSEPVTYQDFLRWKLKMNIGYLRRKIDYFKKIVAYYEGEILKIKEQLRENTRNTMSAEDREALRRKIEGLLQEQKFFPRMRHSSTERIRELQRQLVAAYQAKPSQINTTMVHVDLSEVQRLIDENLLKGEEIVMQSETKPFQGEAAKLIAMYQDEVEHVNREYIRPLEQRMAANEHWLSKIKERN